MRLIDADALAEVLGIAEECKDCQYDLNGYFCKNGNSFVNACEAIYDAPTIEAEWIPVSERLPVVDIPVLVTNGSEMWVCSLFESPDLQDGEYQWEDNYGHWHGFDAWTAWMPLPEPPKEGQSDA